jgi:hypothetical protein
MCFSALTKTKKVAFMRKLTPYVIIGCVLLVLVSCSKEKSIDTPENTPGSGNGNAVGKTEKGTWKFVSMRGITLETIEFSQFGDAKKLVSTSDYTSTNNTGTVKFDGSTMSGIGLTYSIDGVAKTYIYTNGTLDDSLELPFGAIVPPTNSTANYKKIGSDSIYVQSGAFTNVGTGGTTQASSGGYKLAWDGDKMTMTAKATLSKIDLSTGISQKITQHATQIITLQKQ